MRITLCGAAGEVTGSGYLVEAANSRVLVDFGAFQGTRDARERSRSLGPVNPDKLDAVLVTHAHIDHTGRLPLLALHGYKGPIYATPATIDLTQILLADAAKLQEQDAARENARRERTGQAPVTPLYTAEEARIVESLMKPVRLDERTEVAPGISARWFEAGHILGSAGIELTVRDGGAEKVVVCSGDVGPRGSPILRDPVAPERADLVFLESTYGDRDHPPLARTVEKFHGLLKHAAWNHQRMLIPAFAVGRTQAILYHIAQGIREHIVPEFPIYLDSPMARLATQTYVRHRELYDAEAHDLVRRDQLTRDLRNLRIIESVEESKSLNSGFEPCLIIAGSGMCDGGRIVHHLKHNLWKRDVMVIIAGYMAQGSLGRELVDGAKVVEVLGDPVEVRATIQKLNGFSAHAGQTELVEWLHAIGPSHPRVVLTHGEQPQRMALAAKIKERYGVQPALPALGDVIEL